MGVSTECQNNLFVCQHLTIHGFHLIFRLSMEMNGCHEVCLIERVIRRNVSILNYDMLLCII